MDASKNVLSMFVELFCTWQKADVPSASESWGSAAGNLASSNRACTTLALWNLFQVNLKYTNEDICVRANDQRFSFLFHSQPETMSFHYNMFIFIRVRCLNISCPGKHISQAEHGPSRISSGSEDSSLPPTAKKVLRREPSWVGASSPRVHRHRCSLVRSTSRSQKGYQRKTFLNHNGTSPQTKKRLPRAGLDCESNAHKEARSNSWTYCHAWVTALGAGDFSVLTDTVVKNFTADKIMELLELKLDAYSGNGKHPKIRLWSALTKTCAMCSMSPAPNDVLHPHIVSLDISSNTTNRW